MAKKFKLGVRAGGLLIMMALVVHTAHAHLSGYSFEQIVGEYKIDIGIEKERPLVGESTKFNLLLVNKDNTNAPYEKVWVKLTQGQKVYLATGVSKARIGPTTLVYDFPKEGVYELYVRFENEGINKAQATFNITVEPDPEVKKPLPNWLMGSASLILGIILGGALTRVVHKRKPKTRMV